MELKFIRGDIVRWSTPAGTRNMYVVEVWDGLVPQLLVTDEIRMSGETKPILQCDCEVISRQEYTETQTYKRVIKEVKELPNYIIPTDDGRR